MSRENLALHTFSFGDEDAHVLLQNKLPGIEAPGTISQAKSFIDPSKRDFESVINNKLDRYISSPLRGQRDVSSKATP